MVRVEDTVSLQAERVPEAPSRVLLSVCSRPEFTRLLADRTLSVDRDLDRPFETGRSEVRISPSMLANAHDAAITIREALERSWLEAMIPDVAPLALAAMAHVTAIGYLSSLPTGSGAPDPAGYRSELASLVREHAPMIGTLAQVDALVAVADEVIGTLIERDGFEADTAERAALARLIGPALPLALPAEVLFVVGGDHRQRIDDATGCNPYGIPARPLPWALGFSSCTASVPSLRAYRAADDLRRTLLRAALTGDLLLELASASAWCRSAVAERLGLGLDETDVVLMPSGTDVELIVAAFAVSHGRPVTSIVVAPDEVGSGTVLAAGGRHFSTETPAGSRVEPGDHVAGFGADQLLVETVAVRDDVGALRSADRVEADIGALLDDAHAEGRLAVLHLVDGSKTGVRLPRSETVDRWQEQLGSDLIVVVDAAQVRVDQRSIADHVRRGRLVFASGSKFYAGPPFSAALLSPAGWLVEGGGFAAPVGLREYLDRWSCPPGARWLAEAAGHGCNIGLLLRWQAALAEMTDYHSVAPGVRDEIVRGFAAGVIEAIERHPRVDLIPSPWTEREALAGRGLDELPTIFTFTVTGPDGAVLGVDAARELQRQLQRDLSGSVPAESSSALRAARSEIFLGQPVSIGAGGGTRVGGLRIALGAPTLSDIVFGHQWGPSWQARLDRALDDVRLALDKIDLILDVDLGSNPATSDQSP